jgi:hypothetical protein
VTDDIIRDLHIERSQILDRLMEARRLLAGAQGHLIASYIQLPYMESIDRKRREIEAFLDAGMFGDKVPAATITDPIVTDNGDGSARIEI